MYHGKVIYNPSGKAGEYSYWAANFYNGCSAKCEYCYNRKGITAKVLGGDVPALKKCLKDGIVAYQIFLFEMTKNIDALKKHGLFFNFVSDPCLKETIQLNSLAIAACVVKEIPVKVLTKQTWWVDEYLNTSLENHIENKKYISFGFTLTGHDELEPGAATNYERIESMRKLHDAGFKTWASIEPIIDFESSMDMIAETRRNCDLYKIGLQSGKKYSFYEIKSFIDWCILNCKNFGGKIYFKDSFLKAAGINRSDLPSNCVTRDFNL